MKKRRIKTVLTLSGVTIIMSLCMGLVLYRAGGCLPLADDAALIAGRLSFINGYASDIPTEPAKAQPAAKPLADTPVRATEAPERPKDNTHTGEGLPVTELSVSNGNMSYENISVRNTADADLDIEALLNSELPFSLTDDHSVQVLVYHTHSCESYLPDDTGVYYEDFYPRSTDAAQGVMAVGESLVKTLKEHGIGAVHDTTLHDYPSYEGSYARSWETLEGYREKYPDIKVTIDLHRDSMTAQDGTKYKPTFTYDGDKAAQIMIMSGYDTSGSFDFWDENLIFAMKLQKRCEDKYPGMTRPLSFGEFTYNMNFNNGSLLIEVGTDANTPEEACRSGCYLGEALASLLTDEGF